MTELRNMDALDLLANLTPGSVDAIITDPPYGTTNATWDKTPDWPAFFHACWRVLKKNGVLLIFSQNPTAAQIITQQRRWFRYEWVWEKPNAVGVLNANRMPLRAHELVLMGFNPGADCGSYRWPGHSWEYEAKIYERTGVLL